MPQSCRWSEAARDPKRTIKRESLSLAAVKIQKHVTRLHRLYGNRKRHHTETEITVTTRKAPEAGIYPTDFGEQFQNWNLSFCEGDWLIDERSCFIGTTSSFFVDNLLKFGLFRVVIFG